MPGRSDEPVGPLEVPLGVLIGRVHGARDAVQALRHGQVQGARMIEARRGLRLALENYVTCLEAHNLPVPGALQRELHLQQELFG